MISKKIKLVITLCMVFVLGVSSTVISYAATSSTASESAEKNEITADGNANLDVSIVVGNTFSVKIPKSITLNGATKSGTYTVAVKGDVAGDEVINVVPSATVTMSQDGKDDVTATVTQTKTSWDIDELDPDEYSETTGTIAVPGATGGTWSGTATFTISVTKATP